MQKGGVPTAEGGRNAEVSYIIDWVVPVLNADWLTAVVYQTVYHEYDNTYQFYRSNCICNQFIIAIRHLGGLWYMANISRLRAVSRHSTLRRA